MNDKNNLVITLIKTPSPEGDAFSIYHFDIKDASGTHPNKEIPIADFRRMGGGISLLEWKLHQHNNKLVLSTYLEISAMGHDLDQWTHYDFKTGEKLKDPALEERKEFQIR